MEEVECQEQMQLLQTLLGAQVRGIEAISGNQVKGSVKLTKLTQSQDIEAYLTMFERLMVAHDVKKDKWAFRLAPNLIDKAQQAYAAMSTEDAAYYDRVKETILQQYNINADTYRQHICKEK